MRSILSLVLLSLTIIANIKPSCAATPVDALFDTFEASIADYSLVALCNGEYIVLVQAQDMAVEVKAHATAKIPSATMIAHASAAASFVGVLARTATA